MRTRTRFAVSPAFLVVTIQSALAQSVPGFDVTTYANVPEPVLLHFTADGTLYVGRDTVASGTATPLKIHKVGIGGAPVTEYGNDVTPDPDTICLDVAGVISGVPGTLLVGGLIPPSNTSGRISGIRPNGTVVTLFESSQIDNPIEMKFDGLGRLLFVEGVSGDIWVSAAGEFPTVLFQLPGAVNCTAYLAVSSDNEIYTCGCDGIIRIHASNGALIDDNFADVGNLSSIEFGPGGAFSDDLYALNTTTGNLVRISDSGVVTPFGSGFGVFPNIKDLAVGAGPAAGALYVSRFNPDQVLMIAPACAADIVTSATFQPPPDGTVNGADLAYLLGEWGNNPGSLADIVTSRTFAPPPDGKVDGADLAFLLGAWGACE
jgi:hypothetical protein